MTIVDEDAVTSTGSGASRPLRKDAARNRQLLLEAGREVFAERGLDASLDDVAHRAGLGVGTAYRHFGNKTELAKAIFAEAIENVIARAEQAAVADDPWSGLVDFIHGSAEAQTADRGLREAMMGVHDAHTEQQIHDRLTVALTTAVDRARAAGQLRADAAVSDVGALVIMLCTIADMTAELMPKLWRRYLPMLLDGLRPGGELPEPPMDDQLFREAMASFKQRRCPPD